MQWQHHIVHIGKGNVKQELVAKNNWAWQSKKNIAQASLDDTLQSINAHRFVKELLAKFLAYLEASVTHKPNITLNILLEEVSTMRVSDLSCFPSFLRLSLKFNTLHSINLFSYFNR